MISILLVSHYDIAAAMHHAIEEIMGEQKLFEFISIRYDYAMEDYEALLREKIIELKLQGDLIVFSDFLMGTPFNLLISLAGKFDFAHVSGLNMPMLLYLLQHRSDSEKSLEYLCDACIKAGEQGITNVNDLIESIRK